MAGLTYEYQDRNGEWRHDRYASTSDDVALWPVANPIAENHPVRMRLWAEAYHAHGPSQSVTICQKTNPPDKADFVCEKVIVLREGTYTRASAEVVYRPSKRILAQKLRLRETAEQILFWTKEGGFPDPKRGQQSHLSAAGGNLRYKAEVACDFTAFVLAAAVVCPAIALTESPMGRNLKSWGKNLMAWRRHHNLPHREGMVS